MKDFLHNRPRVDSPGRVVESPDAAAAAAQAAATFGLGALHALPAAAGKHEVAVEAIKEGDRVTKLIVTCRCGERIEILCAYGPNGR